MLELVNENTLIKGEKYYVKRKPRFTESKKL